MKKEYQDKNRELAHRVLAEMRSGLNSGLKREVLNAYNNAELVIWDDESVADLADEYDELVDECNEILYGDD